jgi:hypothetical protein
MKCLECVLAVASLAAPMYCQECQLSSSAQLSSLTQMARRVIESGTYTGWDDKAFSRAGDLGSVAIVRALTKDGSINPMQVRSVLLLVRTSFECLDVCVQSADDKNPSVTLLLLEHLREHESPGSQSDIDIEDVRAFVLNQSEIAKHAK